MASPYETVTTTWARSARCRCISSPKSNTSAFDTNRMNTRSSCALASILVSVEVYINLRFRNSEFPYDMHGCYWYFGWCTEKLEQSLPSLGFLRFKSKWWVIRSLFSRKCSCRASSPSVDWSIRVLYKFWNQCFQIAGPTTVDVAGLRIFNA